MSAILTLLLEHNLIDAEEPRYNGEHTCNTCSHYKAGKCLLYSGECINNPNKPYWIPKKTTDPSLFPPFYFISGGVGCSSACPATDE